MSLTAIDIVTLLEPHDHNPWGDTVLKRAGLTTAGITAGLLLAAPAAAFAGGGEEDWDHDGDHFSKIFEANDAEENEAEAGLVNVSDNNLLIPIQACNNNVPVNVLGVQVPVMDIAGTLGLLGASDANQASNDDSCGQESDLDD